MSDDFQAWALALKTIAEQLLSEVDATASIVHLTCDLVQSDHADRIRTYLTLLQYRQKLEFAMAAMRVLVAASQQAGSGFESFSGLKDDIESYTDIAQHFFLALDEFERRFLSGGQAERGSDRELLEGIYKKIVARKDNEGIVDTLKEKIRALKDKVRIEFDQKVQSLSTDQREIYEAADTEIARTGQEIMAHTKSRLTLNPHQKNSLSLLVKLGLLTKASAGYLKVPPPVSQD